MDFSQFDSRKRAEDGVFVPLCDPYTRNPITSEGGNPGFMVRGTAARSVQARMAEMAKLAKESTEGEEDQTAAMEKLHADLIASAERFIVRAVNMDIAGTDVDDNPEMIRRILDMTFPDMKVKKDGEGNVVMTKVKAEDGTEVEIPKFELANWPFAQQVVEAAEDGVRFLVPPVID